MIHFLFSSQSVVQIHDFHVLTSVVALTIEYCFIVLKNKLKNFSPDSC